jgi:hypothetical protein
MPCSFPCKTFFPKQKAVFLLLPGP